MRSPGAAYDRAVSEGSGQAPSLSKAEGTGQQPRLRWLRELWESTIGMKLIVGVSGLILAGYVLLHALGNLKALQGTGGGDGASVDKYGEWLRTFGAEALPREGVLWTVRGVLIVALILHVAGIAALIARNSRARPAEHRAKVIGRSISSRTMAFTGVVVLAFIVFHILQFTTLTIQPTPVAEGTVYANLHGAFQELWIVAVYVIAVVLLGFHLRHALWSVIQTAGLDAPNRNPAFRRAATGTAVAITVAFALVPILFFAGVLPEPAGALEASR